MNSQYLIPANSKRSMLILGLFTPIDLAIFGVGVLITVVLLFTINTNEIREMMIILTPLIISSIMVAPVPNHRNVWNFTANIYKYFTNARRYYWRGWCITNGEEEK